MEKEKYKMNRFKPMPIIVKTRVVVCGGIKNARA
jgi:hypothetical protein